MAGCPGSDYKLGSPIIYLRGFNIKQQQQKQS